MYDSPVPYHYLAEQFSQADHNKRNKIGFIAIHPQDGVFLGVDENKTSIFKPAAELDADQMIPTFRIHDWVSSEACTDERIVECSCYLVDVADTEKQLARAGDVIKDGEVKLTEKPAPFKVVENTDDIFSRLSIKFAHAVEKIAPALIRNRAFNPVVK